MELILHRAVAALSAWSQSTCSELDVEADMGVAADAITSVLGAGPIYEKRSRWMRDSIIVSFPGIADALSRPLALKVHEDIFPIAAHIYNDANLLERLTRSGVTPVVFGSVTKHVPGRGDLRATAFSYVRGSTVAQELDTGVSPKTLIPRIMEMTTKLLDAGVHPLFRDFGDFITPHDGVGTQLMMTDHNAMLDVRSADTRTRLNALRPLEDILARLLASHQPYRGAFQSATDPPSAQR